MHAPTLPSKAPSPLRHPPRLRRRRRRVIGTRRGWSCSSTSSSSRRSRGSVRASSSIRTRPASCDSPACSFRSPGRGWASRTTRTASTPTTCPTARPSRPRCSPSAAMAVAIGEIGDGWSTRFAIAYIAVRLLLLVLYGRARTPRPGARDRRSTPTSSASGSGVAALDRLARGSGAGALCPLGAGPGGGVRHPARRLARDLARRRSTAVHLGERFGLFTIIVLGEAVVAVVSGTELERWADVAGGGRRGRLRRGVAMWWIYFDFEGGSDPARRAAGRSSAPTATSSCGCRSRRTARACAWRSSMPTTAAEIPGARWALAGSAAVFLLILAAFHVASARNEPAVIGARPPGLRHPARGAGRGRRRLPSGDARRARRAAAGASRC